jgi:hypothetical protein
MDDHVSPADFFNDVKDVLNATHGVDRRDRALAGCDPQRRSKNSSLQIEGRSRSSIEADLTDERCRLHCSGELRFIE